MANQQIPQERQAAYYLGMVLMVGGFLLCFGSIACGGLSVGHGMPSGPPTGIFGGFFLGMILTVVGGILRGIGSRGLAGSGIVLDPEQARRDVEPWSRMGGGMVKDALDEAGIELGHKQEKPPEESEPDFEEKLRKLHKLYEDAILSREEYEREKQQILDKL